MPATATSDWPTPTVSTSTTSKPAASHSSIASRVRRATPPSVPPAGDGRMNASGWRGELAPCGSCRRGSSRRVRVLDGSTASTATRWPCSTSVQAERLDERRLARRPARRRCRRGSRRPVCGQQLVEQRRRPRSRWSARVDSTRVIARASARRSPSRTAVDELVALGRARRQRRRGAGGAGRGPRRRPRGCWCRGRRWRPRRRRASTS